jgi:hypothetical protein
LARFGGGIVPRTPQEEEKLARLLKLRGRRLELANVQIAADFSWSPPSAQFIDFGTVHPRRRFVDPLFSPARDGIFRVGRRLLGPQALEIQPIPELALDPFQFSRTSVTAMGFFLATGFREGRVSQTLLRKIMRQSLRQTGLWSVSGSARPPDRSGSARPDG